MIISNEKKFIYLRVPKTGSTSVSVYLYENLPLEKSIIRIADNSDVLKKEENIKKEYFTNTTKPLSGGVHATLTQIIDAQLLEHPLDSYMIYAVCRNPVDRYLSFQNMMKKVNNIDITENYSVFKLYMGMFEASPQSIWLMHNKTLANRVFLYEDIHLMVNEIAKKYDVYDTSAFSKYALRKYEKQVTTIPSKAMDYISVFWQDDFGIYNRLKNQK